VSPAQTGSEIPRVRLATVYPPASWRVAEPERLADVVLWFSHILIRHQDVPKGDVSFDLLSWTPAPAPPARTRQAAFAFAQAVGERAKLAPREFARLAREHSEDIATRDNGGSFGGVQAFQLYSWGALLDVLSALEPGDVSEVVETDYGFHIFQRHAPAALQQVSGSRIVIAYDQAPWLHAFLARGTLPSRSRAEALARAEQVYQKAREAPTSFERLVDEYSDHQDVLRAGDFGSWSTHEVTPVPREIEVLQKLEVGEVAPPMDSRFGVQIIKRTPNRPRQQYAITTVEQRVDPNLPAGDPQSSVVVRQNLEAILEMLRVAPERFSEFQTQYCCTTIEQWEEGRGWAPAEQAIAGLQPGGVSEPVSLSRYQYAIIKRVVPSPTTTARIHFGLPARSETADAPTSRH
jgi:parvulin-like peptidyl-prolyl isomerase